MEEYSRGRWNPSIPTEKFDISGFIEIAKDKEDDVRAYLVQSLNMFLNELRNKGDINEFVFQINKK